MTETPENAPQGITARGVLSRACRLYLDNFLPFFSLSALGALLYTIAALLGWTGVEFLQWFSLSLLFPFPIVFLWAGAALTVRADAALRGEELSFRASLQRVAPRFWWYAQAAVLSVLAWLVGLPVVVIGGLFTGTVFSLAGTAAALEEPSVRPGPLRRSYRLARRRFASVLLATLALWALLVASGVGIYFLEEASPRAARLAACAVWGLIWPFWTAVHVVLYRGLVAGEEGEEKGEEPGTRSCLLGCGLAVLLVLLGAALTLPWAYALRGPDSEEEASSRCRTFSGIVEPDLYGLKLALPDGWEARRWWEGESGNEGVYTLQKYPQSGADVIHLWSRPLSDVTASGSLSEQDADRIQELSVDELGRAIPPDESYDSRSTERLKSDGRVWWHLSLAWTPEGADPPEKVHRDHFYSVFRDRVVVVTAYSVYEATHVTRYREDLAALRELVPGIRLREDETDEEEGQ